MIKPKKYITIFCTSLIYLMIVTNVFASGDIEEDFMFRYKDVKHNNMNPINEKPNVPVLHHNTNYSISYSTLFTSYIGRKFENVFFQFKMKQHQLVRMSDLPWEITRKIARSSITILTDHFFRVAYAEEAVDTQTKIIMEGIPHSIKSVRDILKNRHLDQNVTVLLGNTSAGKTTVYNYLQGMHLEAKKCDKTGKIIIDKKKPDGEIAHGMVSGTALPSVSKDGKYIDCPGFLDNRTIGEQALIQQDIINGYSLYRLFLNEKVKNVRLVLVVSSGEILDIRGSSFLGVIKQIDELFLTRPSNVDITNGLSLIVTKGTLENENQIRSAIKLMLEQNPSLSNLQKEVLEHLKKKDSPIEFFNAPTKPGRIPTSKPLIKSKSYIERNKYRPGIPMSSQSKLNMVEVSKIIEDDISNCLITFFKNLEGSTNNLIAAHNKKASELRTLFGQMASKLDSAQSMSRMPENDSFKENVKGISEVLLCLDHDQQKKFSELIVFNKIFRKIVPHSLPIQLDLNSRGMLTKSFTYLEPFSEKPKPKLNANSLQLEAHIVGTSDLQDSLKSKKNIHNLTAYGISSLLIDEDLNAPEVSVALVSPFWSVIGSRTINVKGKNNKVSMTQASTGEDGKPGEPGGSGGSFYGAVDKLNHANFLTINVSGGAGGKGQDGGDGKHGKDGVDGRLVDLQKMDPDTLRINDPLNYSWPWKILTYPFTANNDTREIYKDGTDGEKGGNAGAGGIGGLGGIPGSVTFTNTKFENFTPDNVEILRYVGKQGENGIHGKIGIGGRNGKRYEGINTKSSINTSELFQKSAVEGVLGGVVGGGIGIATGVITTVATVTTAAVAWPIVAGVAVGAMIPSVGSKIHQSLWSGWNEEPHLLQYEEYASNGIIPEHFNSRSLKKPEKSHIINTEEIHINWNQMVSRNQMVSNSTIE